MTGINLAAVGKNITRWMPGLAPCAALAAPAVAASQCETGTPKFEHAIPNIPGKSLVAVEGESAYDYHGGESRFEVPGAHHIQGQNMRKAQPATLWAVIVVATDNMQLTIPDSESHTTSLLLNNKKASL